MIRRMNLLKLVVPLDLRGACCLHWSSHRVRNTFIEYFKGRDHHHVRSSPVVPWNDPTLAFVNAGMNQFKPIFLGQTQREHRRATSSQKCIRVGGKHNDLAQVGRDTYHHTFFEMLGSWSFGDYFKKEACSMAWELLTNVYKLPSNHLYVTYFGGEDALGLEADEEVKEIWRSIGVPYNRILPFGMKDNFWEMGMFGPCGPCTEIHYDRLGRSFASDRVNLGVEDLIELWNIVFIQYERLKDCSLQNLGTHYVDTGMGLERVTAVLNNKASNYDTDLFIPLFSAIKKMSGKPEYAGQFSDDGQCLDTAYRILADHMRMVTVALADGMFPEEGDKLRYIIRRAINIGSNNFGFTHGNHNLVELTQIVAATLGETYPEVCDQLERVHIILEHEEKYFYEMQENCSREWKDLLLQRPELNIISDWQTPGMIDGVRAITCNVEEWKKCDSRLPGHFAFQLYDTHGLHIDLIEELAEIYGLTVDQEGFNLALNEARQRTRTVGQQKLESDETFKKDLQSSIIGLNLPVTDDSSKYLYKRFDSHYEFTPIKTKVLLILQDGKQVEKTVEGRIGVILEATNFYHEAGGQEGDTGRLCTSNSEMSITSVDNVGGYIVHWGTMDIGEISVGDEVTAKVCETRRMRLMQHHTATHLLNSAVKAATGLAFQKSSHVASDYCYLQVRTYQALDHTIIHKIENLVKRWIDTKSPINRRTVKINEMLQEPSICLLPGEVYPDIVHIIATKLADDEFILSSIEPCCGTHLHNTGDIGNFVIVNVNTAGFGNTRLRCVCSEAATLAEENAMTALQQLEEWEILVQKEINASVKERLSSLEKELRMWCTHNKDLVLPYLAHVRIMEFTNEYRRLLKNALRGDANKEMVKEMMEVIGVKKDGPIIHLLETDFGTSKAVLSKATVLVRQRPMLVLAKSEGIIKGRSIIPEGMLSCGVSATAWMTCVSKVLGGKVTAPRGQNPLLVCNFRSKKADYSHIGSKLKKALEDSKYYIDKFL
ncbi:alanine--tRNA ligase, mitochondrial isoform X1 [Procambarus clarkii]|uniref:alanine--tRNA ligase, mitochondrial isoform X1 n=1 Tax=Procambarus clarkii TaxID=6728 RepID=UPI003743FED0